MYAQRGRSVYSENSSQEQNARERQQSFCLRRSRAMQRIVRAAMHGTRMR